MDKKQNNQRGSDKGLMKSGRSNRTRAGRGGRGQQVPRVMILAGVVIVAGAAWLYWPAGNSTPTGVGEQQTVVTNLPVTASPMGENGPSSGDVDINQQTTTLTAEEPDSGQEAAAPVEKVVEKPAAKPKAKPKPVKKTPAPTTPGIEPSDSGSYAVQTGSFGNADNADKESARLKARGWNTSIRAGNNSSGQMVFRVWITYFNSRQDAQTFIRQNSKHVPGAIPVHR